MPVVAVPPVTPLVVERPFTAAAQNWLPSHRGVDLRIRPGQPVHAVHDGRIVFAGRIADRPVLVLRAAGVRFTLEPVRSGLAVATRVGRGEQIGTVAHGGHCRSRCLHWGAKVGDSYVDPTSFLPHRRPVLKPLRSRSAAAARADPARTCCGSG